MPFIEIGKNKNTSSTAPTSASIPVQPPVTAPMPAPAAVAEPVTSPYPTLSDTKSMATASASSPATPVYPTLDQPTQPTEASIKEMESANEVGNDIREIKGPGFENEVKPMESTPAAPSEAPKPELKPEPKPETETVPVQELVKAPVPEPMKEPVTIAAPTPEPKIEPKSEPVDVAKLKTNVADIHEFMKLAIEKNASDIHISVANPVFIRVDGRLQGVGVDLLNEEQVKKILEPVLKPALKEELEKNMEVDFMYYEESVNSRFRVNVFFEKGRMAAAFRLIPTKVRTIDELKLPFILKEFSKIPYGLVLVTGPTGSGKSTTIAAMIEEINRTEPKHIVTIEDPVEYVYEKERSLIAQRSMHYDTKSWNNALRSALRQDPDVVVIGEMRDFETIASAMTIAETGHLVFATLHTNTAAQSVDRIIDVFPEGQQNQVRAQLAGVISGVISQRLVPLKNGGRKAAIELLIGTIATKNAIREGKTHQIDNIIQTSADVGMQTLEKALVEMIRNNEIDVETAKEFSAKPEEIDLLLR